MICTENVSGDIMIDTSLNEHQHLFSEAKGAMNGGLAAQLLEKQAPVAAQDRW